MLLTIFYSSFLGKRQVAVADPLTLEQVDTKGGFHVIAAGPFCVF